MGPPPSDEQKMGRESAEHAVGSVQQMLQEKGFLPMPQKPLSAWVCLFMTKQYFNCLGRPTVDDYIELNARTDRGR
jgi:hypothetical protein